MVNTYFTYVPSLIVTVTLGLLVLWNKRKRVVNISFALLIFSLAFWIICLLIADHIRSYNIVLFWSKMAIVGPFLVPSLFLYFSNVFPDKEKTEFSWKESIVYILPLLFLILAPTNFNVAKLTVQNYGADVTPGPLYYILLFFLVIYLSIGLNNLRKTYRKSDGLRKLQIRYVFWGVLLTAVFTVVTNIIFVIFNFSAGGIWGPPSVLILIGSTTYAIVRHRLLDIRLVITRSLIYGILLTVVSLAFILITIVSANFFGSSATSRNTISIFIAILIVFGLDPFRNILSRITDRIFFKAKVDYQALLREVSEILAFEINRDELIRKIRVTLKDGLKVRFTATLLRKTTSGMTERFDALPDMLTTNPNLSLRNDSALVHFLREHRHYSLIESLERKIEDTPEAQRRPLVDSKEEFERLGASLVTPIFAQGHLIAILALGPKLSGDSFSNEDLNLIEVLSPQIGSAIQKANLFEEVRQFGESLKVKVQEATEELQERNVSLQTLQHITKEITRTLDFNQVVQQIANSVSTELGYVGGVLVFLDDDGFTLRARAISETPLTKKALHLLPQPFTTFSSDIRQTKSANLAAQVIRSGQIRMTDDMAEVLSPPVPKTLIGTMQKFIGVKSMVIIPILSEGRVIGAIEIGTRKKKDDITEQEIATMQSLADELGVVSRNIKLFDQIRLTNEQLEVANKHLQELDRAKSEFVSIASHQLRTPMTGIMGYLSMMTQGDFGKIAPAHQKILSDLLAESQRMIRLINQFLNVSKIEAGKFTYTKNPVHIEELINREIEETSKAAKDKGLKLTTKLPKTPLPVVVADADKLQDVVLNLIDNAIKYTAAGSIVVGAEALDDHIHVWVKDTGIGIKKEDAPELFNKFVRGSGIAQIHPDGSGLGLFIAKSIVDSHGGRIWAESDGEGKGSTFQFIIPTQPPAEVEPHPLDAAAHVVKPR